MSLTTIFFCKTTGEPMVTDWKPKERLIVNKRKKITKKRIGKFMLAYGWQLGVLLILANVILFSATQFFSQAETEDNPRVTAQATASALTNNASESATPKPTVTVAPPTATPTPAGAIVRLSFSVPGIGSGSAQYDPQHRVRNVTLLLYHPDDNSADSRTKPLYEINAFANFDENENNPTYSSFVNTYIDLGKDVETGKKYQIVIKTDKSLLTLVKEKEEDVGGELFAIEEYQPVTLPQQDLIIGDIYPIGTGDNIMDISDYNVLVTCFGNKGGDPACGDRLAADLDDNGYVDGVDYNLMLLSFRKILDLGFPVPTIDLSAKPTIVDKLSKLTPGATRPVTPLAKLTVTKSATGSPTLTQGESGTAGMIVGVIFFILLLIIFVVLFLFNSRFKAFVIGILPAKFRPQTQETETPPATEEQAPVDQTLEILPPGQVPIDETPQPGVQPTTSVPTESVSSEAPTEQAPATPSTIDKEYYIKKQSDDDAKTGVWIDMTDDNGQILGHYTGTAVADGFAHIKGVMKTEGDKTFVEISEIKPSE